MSATAQLFSPLSLRELTFKNRIFVSPMCQYSAVDGVPDHWHLVHLGSRAVGGAALVMAEATAVRPAGRISPGDLGLWNDTQTAAFQPIAKFIAEQGAVPGIQLAHAGRKASMAVPWAPSGRVAVSDGGWLPEAPSPIPFSAQSHTPHELAATEIAGIVADFRAAAGRALAAGFQVVEIHMAHGYLLHEFLSPLSNQRRDEYGGPLPNRMRLPLQVAAAARQVWPTKWPVFVRISVTDWAPSDGWDLPQSIELSHSLAQLGIDLIDCSSGGTLEHAAIPTALGYQVPFAAAIRAAVGIPTSAVGLIVTATQAEEILRTGQATLFLWPANFCVIPISPCMRPRSWGSITPGQSSTSARSVRCAVALKVFIN